MAFTLVTITHTYPAGSTGTVTFSLDRHIFDGSDFQQDARIATLNGSAAISIPLPANTAPGTLPAGSRYFVTEALTGRVVRRYAVTIPHNAGGSIDLYTLTRTSLDDGDPAVVASRLDALESVGTGVFNVRDAAFGARGDGVTLDDAGIGLAWSALKANGGGTLFFPDTPQGYLTTGLVFTGGSNFAIRGNGGARIWTARGTVSAPTQATHNVVTIADCTDFVVEGLVIDGRRDTIAADQYLTANAASGQKNVTVQDGTKYVVGEMVSLSGGLTANGGTEKNFTDWFLHITAIAGNVLTLESNLAHAYTATGADGGAYLSRYQTGDASTYTVAGRGLGNEDAQNGLHLISCSRFQVVNNTARNVWESPIKLGNGFATTTPTDGCYDGTIANNQCLHGYDQGVSVWMSERIAVVGNVCKDAGWGGVVFTHSRDCSATGNVCTDNLYSPASDLNQGSGIAVEGGERITVAGNVCTRNNSNGVRISNSPVFNGTTTVALAVAAGATTFTPGSVSFMKVGSSHTIQHPTNFLVRENFQIASIAGGVVTLTAPLRLAYSAGANIIPRHCVDVTISDNICSSSVWNSGIHAVQAIGLRIIGNDCSNAGVGADTFGTCGIQLGDGTAANGCHGAYASGNTCGGNAQEGIVVDSCLNVTLDGNNCFANGLPTTSKHGIKGYGLVGCAIINNHCERNTDSGIYLQPGSANNQRTMIARNVCTRNAKRGIFVDSGLATGLVISGNECTYNGEPGIHLLGTQNSLITGNLCANQAGQEGIRLDDNGANFCLYNRVSDNLLFDDQGGSATQSWGYRELGNTDRNNFTGNRLYGNTNAGQRTLATNTVSSGNGIGTPPTYS